MFSNYNTDFLFIGKSRSIAIPANREAAKEKKKQRLTKERIDEMKRQVAVEGKQL